MHCSPPDRSQAESPLPSCNVPVLQDWENLCSSPQTAYHPSGSISCSLRSDPKTHLSNVGQGGTALQRLSFTPPCFSFPACALQSALPHPCPAFTPFPPILLPKQRGKHSTGATGNSWRCCGSSLWGGKRQVLSSAAEKQETLENRLKRVMGTANPQLQPLSKPPLPKGSTIQHQNPTTDTCEPLQMLLSTSQQGQLQSNQTPLTRASSPAQGRAQLQPFQGIRTCPTPPLGLQQIPPAPHTQPCRNQQQEESKGF